MTFKSLYFMRLIRQIAPLINAMENILWDIKWFLFVYFTFIISHSFAINNLARNQFDEVDGNLASVSNYYKLNDIVWYIYKGHLMGLDSSHFRGNNQEGWYVSFYIYMTIFVKLILLNMLIGLMGASISRSKTNADATKRVQMCSFVTDNWFLNPIENKEKVVYVISARQITAEEEENEDLMRMEKN